MDRVNVIYDIGLDYLYDDLPNKPRHPNKKEHLIKITEDVLDNLIKEGTLRKTNDGYVFVGKRPKKK
jgi:hypothetical protein